MTNVLARNRMNLFMPARSSGLLSKPGLFNSA
jgi:hypothetical protein